MNIVSRALRHSLWTMNRACRQPLLTGRLPPRTRDPLPRDSSAGDRSQLADFDETFAIRTGTKGQIGLSIKVPACLRFFLS